MNLEWLPIRVAQPFVSAKCGRTPETFAKDQFNDNISSLRIHDSWLIWTWANLL